MAKSCFLKQLFCFTRSLVEETNVSLIYVSRKIVSLRFLSLKCYHMLRSPEAEGIEHVANPAHR